MRSCSWAKLCYTTNPYICNSKIETSENGEAQANRGTWGRKIIFVIILCGIVQIPAANTGFQQGLGVALMGVFLRSPSKDSL